MNLSSNCWFWILQVLGWSLPIMINAYGKFKTSTLSLSYVFGETLIIILAGIFASTLLRNYLKKQISFSKFNALEWRKIILAYTVSSIIYILLMFLSVPLGKIVLENYEPLSTLKIISTIINGFIFILFWSILYFSIKLSRQYRINQIQKLQLEKELKESELNTLKGQINPHFMFNSLNNIRGLMLEDVAKSREMITRLSEMLRYSLTKNKVDKITLKEELEMVNNYIELSKIQFENRLEFSSSIKDNLSHLEIPPMIIQMLIENAIKHGVSKLKEGGKIDLIITEENKKIKIEVRNSGTLETQTSSTKVGLENIQKRLKLLYKDQAFFSLNSEQDFVIATIKIPL